MNRRTLAGFLLIIALSLTARLVPGPRTIDDAFITFRYARNLLAGQGFVYNPGERVMGTTTPLYTLLMAGLGALSGGTQANFPLLALGFNTLADAATGILLWRIGKRLGGELAGFGAALIWTVAPYSVTFAIGGMETSVYVLLLTLVVFFYLEQKLELAAFCGALAMLTRVDALILAVPISLGVLVRWFRARKAPPWKAVLALVVPLLLWYGFSAFYFHSIFPHSVSAKLVAYRLEPGASFIRLVQHYATPFMDYNLLSGLGIGIGLILYPFLYLVGGRVAWNSDRRSLAVFLYPWLYFLAFALPNPLIFRWYLTPPLPIYFLGIFLGAEQIWKRLAGTIRLPESLGRDALIGALILLFPIVSTLSDWRIHPDHGPDRPAPGMAYIQLELLYRQAALDLQPKLKPGSVLAAGDVGVLGFTTSAKILDTVGLNSPEALEYYPLDASMYEINYAVAPNLILDKNPDFVVILEVYGRKGLLKDAHFQALYHLIETIDTDMYGSRGMLIFERNE